MDVEVVQRHRHVRAYEELTVEYGVGYWAARSKLCRCRSPKCQIKKRDENGAFVWKFGPGSSLLTWTYSGLGGFFFFRTSCVLL